jgi:hypothetical protein
MLLTYGTNLIIFYLNKLLLSFLIKFFIIISYNNAIYIYIKIIIFHHLYEKFYINKKESYTITLEKYIRNDEKNSFYFC